MPKRNTAKKSTFKITGDMIIGDVIRAFPQTVRVFAQMGIHCIGCYIANFESIEEGVGRHGIDPELVIKKLNEIINKKDVRRSPPASKSGRKKRNADLHGTGRHASKSRTDR